MNIDYETLIKQSIYVTPEMGEYLKACWEAHKKRNGYEPYSTFVGKMLEEYKNHAC
jgi:hypothetical protein